MELATITALPQTGTPAPQSTPETMSLSTAPSLDQEHLWTVNEAAKFLRKSPRWLWSALNRRPEEAGSIPHVRVGAAPRFFPDNLAALLRAACPPAATFAAWRAAEEKRKQRAITLLNTHVTPLWSRRSATTNGIGVPSHLHNAGQRIRHAREAYHGNVVHSFHRRVRPLRAVRSRRREGAGQGCAAQGRNGCP